MSVAFEYLETHNCTHIHTDDCAINVALLDNNVLHIGIWERDFNGCEPVHEVEINLNDIADDIRLRNEP